MIYLIVKSGKKRTNKFLLKKWQKVGYQKMPANMVCDMNFSLKDQVNKWVWCYVDYKLLLLRENVEKVMNGKKKSLDGSNKFTVFEFHTSKSKSLNNSAIHKSG